MRKLTAADLADMPSDEEGIPAGDLYSMLAAVTNGIPLSDTKLPQTAEYKQMYQELVNEVRDHGGIVDIPHEYS